MAALIPAKEMVDIFQQMLKEKDGYIAGTSGETWTAEKQRNTQDVQAQKYGAKWIGHKVEDCSGAFVRAYRAHGKSIYHGSNRIAREYLTELGARSEERGAALLPISEAKPGMAAFKLRKPGEQLYNLPDEYKPGHKHYNGDLNDYYHIGLVDEDTAYILNSASTNSGFKRSKTADGWDAVGYLKDVQYGEGGDEPMADGYLYEALVDSANDKPVNLRKSPSVNAAILGTVKDGETVRVLNEVDGDWAEVDTGKRKGYMMRGFLTPMEEVEPTAPAPADTCAKALEEIIKIAQAALFGDAKG